MSVQNEEAYMIKLQLALLEGLLTDYQCGARIASYRLRCGQKVDETGEVIAQLRKDIDTLTRKLAGRASP